MNKVLLVADEINKTPADKILDSAVVRGKIIEVYNTVHGTDFGESFLTRESEYFRKICESNPKILNCTSFSVFNAFVDLAMQNLSLEPGVNASCYLVPRSAKVANDVYESRVQLRISGYGELILRARVGQIKYADNPVVIYDNDVFSCSEENGVKNVSYKINLPHTGHSIIGCYIKITRPDGSVDYAWMFDEEVERLKKYSAKSNAYYDAQTRSRVEKANDLYSSNNGGIDAGFLKAKCIKHAFKTYPKVKIGRYTSLESEEDPEIKEEIKEDITPFGEELNPVSQGVTVEDDDLF